MKIIYKPKEESQYESSIDSCSRYILKVNAENWEKEILHSPILTAVDFWEKGCPWCNKFNQIYEEVAPEYTNKLKFTKLNMKESIENQKISVKYGIVGKPTLLFILKGKVLEKVIGIKTQGRLKKVLNDILEKQKVQILT